MTTRTLKLKDAGQSLWLDNIQRRELHDGSMQRMMNEDGICGVTSNPTIFMNAVTKSNDYDEQISSLLQKDKDAKSIYHHITIDDIKEAAELFLPVYQQTGGQDGFISIELNPQLAFNIEESIKEARDILSEIGLPNILIKVPGTMEGISVFKQLTSEGINVNVTLLFSPERYSRIARAYIEGLEERISRGEDISHISSVASFFISRIDTKVDKIIDELSQSNNELLSLRGMIAITVAQVTHALFKELFFTAGFKNILEKGGNIQRLLWASTGTKDPSYSDVKYVEGLVAPRTINTLPPKTISAFRDHGVVHEPLKDNKDEALKILEKVGNHGIDLGKIFKELEDEGVRAFETSYLELLNAIDKKGKALVG